MTSFPWHHRQTRRHDTAKPAAAVEPFREMLGLGLITILFGIAVLAWPSKTLSLLGVLVGVWLLVAGAIRIFGAFAHDQTTGRRVLLGGLGALLIVGGIACLQHVATGVAALAGIIGLAWLVSGIAELAIAFLTHGRIRVSLIAIGAVSLLVGLAFVFWPGLSLGVTILLTGISALLIGAAEVAFAFQLRQRSTAAASPGHD
ncbi:HdeD family acid-resistance protein [Dactylosporangium sp. CA-152071]|uniref:HdeD family acid-resistance protein n=1 Tax=Dactylosporangium sp. CA-152071 TaxID=3239933 RepID=UPI003D93EA93